MRLRLDRLTVCVVALGVVTLNALLFVAGAIVGSIPKPAEPSLWSGGLSARRPIPAAEAAAAPQVVVKRYAPPSLNVRFEPLIQRAAERHNLSPVLVAAVTRVESDFDPLELSHKNARGLMQVIPATGRRFGVGPEELYDPERNIAAGTAYLAWLLDRYRGDVDLALAAYNAGEGAVDKYRGIPPYRETQEYVRKVRRAYEAFLD